MSDAEKKSQEWGGVATTALTLVLWPAHLAGSAWLSYQLLALAGGVGEHGQCTHYGGIEYSWTNVAWLPGGLLLSAGLGVGVLVMFAGSGIAAYFTAASVCRPRWGRWCWRVWLPLLLWFGWVPVPVKATLTYWHTVAF